MRRILKTCFRVLLGILLGFIVFEGLHVQPYLASAHENPATTSLIEARADEARDRGATTETISGLGPT